MVSCWYPAADNRTRVKHRFKFRAVGSSTQASRHSFAVRTVGDWNSLPSHVVERGPVNHRILQGGAVQGDVGRIRTVKRHPLFTRYSTRRTVNYLSESESECITPKGQCNTGRPLERFLATFTKLGMGRVSQVRSLTPNFTVVALKMWAYRCQNC